MKRLLPLLLAACVDTTGGELVTFKVAASGPPDAVAGQPLVFDSPLGYHVTLTRAIVHVGAVYLNRSVPSAGMGEQSCILPGIYSAEVLGGLDVDTLDPARQPFPADGRGTSDESFTGEVWLTGGDVFSLADDTIIGDIAGTADKAGTSYPFHATITIAANRLIPPSDPSMPGSHPICKQRIVTPIRIDFTPAQDGRLLLTIDPRGWFANVDFAGVPLVGAVREFPDDSTNTQSQNLFTGFRAATGVYGFSWEGPSP